MLNKGKGLRLSSDSNTLNERLFKNVAAVNIFASLTQEKLTDLSVKVLENSRRNQCHEQV